MAIKKVSINLDIIDAETLMNLIDDRIENIKKINHPMDLAQHRELISLRDSFKCEIDKVAGN